MDLVEAQARLAGKVAVIVGGGRGIGRAVTLALAGAGIRIATCDVDQLALLQTVKQVESAKGTIFAFEADIGHADDLNRFYDEIEARFDRLDIVVNGVGGGSRSPFLKSTRDQNAADVQRNYGYVVDSLRRAVPLIRKGRRGGSIINLTTIDAYRGAPAFAVCAGAQAATINFTRAMAVELGADQIRVNAIAREAGPWNPSADLSKSETGAELKGSQAISADRSRDMYIPQKRTPTEEDVCNAVLLLASDMTTAITGNTLHVDGGVAAAGGFVDWPHGDGFMPLPMAETLSRLFP